MNELDKVLNDYKPEVIEEWTPKHTGSLPRYARALERIAEIEKEDLSATPPEELGVGLPERPHKRIREQFRRDREMLEAELNAKGDSFYKSKREQLKKAQGFNTAGWGMNSSPFGQSPAFGGWPSAPAQGPATSFAGWGGGYPQQNPFGRSNSLDESSMNQPDQSMYSEMNQEFGSFGEARYETASEADFTDDVYRRAALNPENTIEKEDLLKYDEDDDREDDDENDDEYSGNNINSQLNTDDEEGDYDQDDNIENDVTRDHEFGQGPLSSKPQANHPYMDSFKDLFPDNNQESTFNPNMPFMKGNTYMDSFQDSVQYEVDESRFNKNMATMKGTDAFQDSVADNAEESTYSQNMPTMTGTGTDVVAEGPAQTPAQRPRKQLKEKFMRDREELEKLMNAKGDSIYRRASDPLPSHLAPPQTPYGGFGGPGFGGPPQGPGFGGPPQGPGFGGPSQGFMSAEQIKAQMALQKIAQAALKAAKSRKKGKKGKTQVVFI